MKIKKYTIENLKQIGSSGQKIVIFIDCVIGKNQYQIIKEK